MILLQWGPQSLSIDIIHFIPGIVYRWVSKEQSALYSLTLFLCSLPRKCCTRVVLGGIVMGLNSIIPGTLYSSNGQKTDSDRLYPSTWTVHFTETIPYLTMPCIPMSPKHPMWWPSMDAICLCLLTLMSHSMPHWSGTTILYLLWLIESVLHRSLETLPWWKDQWASLGKNGLTLLQNLTWVGQYWQVIAILIFCLPCSLSNPSPVSGGCSVRHLVIRAPLSPCPVQFLER